MLVSIVLLKKISLIYIYDTKQYSDFRCFLRVGSCLKISSLIQCILLHIDLFLSLSTLYSFEVFRFVNVSKSVLCVCLVVFFFCVLFYLVGFWFNLFLDKWREW